MELKTARGRLFFFLFLVISLPLLQYNFNIIESGALKGAIKATSNVQFSASKWWDGSYQKQKTEYLNDSVGFRPDLVRLNNQLDFWLFKKLHSGDVYVGYDNYLFGKGYVDEYYGLNYSGTDVIRNTLIKLKCVQDTLERLGKTFVLAYAPSKPYYYPEKIPGILREEYTPQISNYRVFRRLGDSLKLKQVDFNEWFIAMKDTTKNLLMSKQGIHWTVYGSILAADSMIRYLEHERHIAMPHPVITAMHYSDTARKTDDDLTTVSNLIYPITKERFSYPDIAFRPEGKSDKPGIIYIGDSFLWLWVYNGMMDNTGTDWQFWLYFKEMWNEDRIWGRQPIDYIDKANWQKPLLNTDCIVVVLTAVNLSELNDNAFFAKVFYDYFYPPDSASAIKNKPMSK